MAFTIDGSDALEQRIQRDMTRVRDEALAVVSPDELIALALGGGYGRGEGGVYVVDGEERVYNDYDFFVIVPFSSRKRRKDVARRLLSVKEKLEPSYGVHVDFSPPMPLDSLPHQPYEVMYMEARAGHHVIYGPEDVLDALPEYDQEHPPLEECARLFMNRGVGLLLANEEMREEEPAGGEAFEFVIRNIYKALLAMGDSVLFAEGRYSPSYAMRQKRFAESPLEGVPDPEGLRVRYQAAMDFKFRPVHSVPEGKSLREWHAETVPAYLDMFLWFERRRLGRPELTWDEYATLPARLTVPRGMARARCIYQNLREGAGMPLAGEWHLHPRDRILKRLPGQLQSGGGPELEGLLKLWSYVG